MLHSLVDSAVFQFLNYTELICCNTADIPELFRTFAPEF